MTENDVFKKNRAIYSFERKDSLTGEPFGDDEHIIFVNCAYESDNYDTDLLKLIHDFRCTKADDMLIDKLADRTRQCKETDEGVDSMCKVVEEAERKAELRKAGAIAMNLLSLGTLSKEDISKSTGVPLEIIEELAKEIKPVSA